MSRFKKIALCAITSWILVGLYLAAIHCKIVPEAPYGTATWLFGGHLMFCFLAVTSEIRATIRDMYDNVIVPVQEAFKHGIQYCEERCAKGQCPHPQANANTGTEGRVLHMPRQASNPGDNRTRRR